MAIPQDWMPSSMSSADKDAFAALFPTDDHAAAAEAWEAYAATLAVEPPVASVSTGVQSISYEKGWSDFDAALDRAQWHRSRAKGVSIEVGGTYAYGWDTYNPRVIASYDAPPLPEIGKAQIMTLHGLEGPKT